MPDEMFNEAVKAAKAGQRRRAKDLLTRLLKADQENVDYWLWMSAVVDTEKEQIFCLQKALKIDPNSIAARRGLVVLGAPRRRDAAPPPPAAPRGGGQVRLRQGRSLVREQERCFRGPSAGRRGRPREPSCV